MRLVVNIPTYCEQENIEEIIRKVVVATKKMPSLDTHILVSDSNSPDKTPQIVKKISQKNNRVHYLNVKRRGLGVGLIKGHRFAIDRLKADILAQLDGDLSHDPSTLPQMVNLLSKGFDLVNGSRLMKGGENRLGWHRRLFTRGSALYCKIMWGTFTITEYTTSYRVFSKKLFEKINLSRIPWKSTTYIIQPAFLHEAIRAGAKIKEIPIIFEDRKRGYSKAQVLAYTLDVLKFGLKVRLQKSKTFIKFLMVGTASYFVNAVTLGILNRGQIYGLQVLKDPLLASIPSDGIAAKFSFLLIDRLFISSIISIEASIILNYFLHDNWTFKYRDRKGSIIGRFLKFNMTSFASPLIQLASILTAARVFHLHEQVGLAIGVIIGLFVNYTINTLWIWKVPVNTN